MPLETGSSIADLDQNWPLGGDTATRGDDHLRLIKAVLKAQFPGSGGQGFSTPITLTEDFLNGLPDALDAIQTSIDSYYPVGKVVLFIDDTDPNDVYPGTWLLITGDASLSLGDGTNGGAGSISGDNTPAVPLLAHYHEKGTLGVAYGGSHAHAGWVTQASAGQGGGADGGQRLSGYGATAENGGHSHTITGTTASAGESSPTIDVRGARLPVNVWKRTV